MSSFGNILQQLVEDTTQRSLSHFAPELVLSGTIVVLLLLRLFGSVDRWIPPYLTSLIGALAALCLSGNQLLTLIQPETAAHAEEFFTGLLVFDQFGAFIRAMLSLFLVLVIALTVLSGIPDREDGPDFYTLLLGATVGMMIMASANHMLMFFVGIEMTSVPSYALVGFLKGRSKSSEAAFKYVVYGAGAAGVMLYGISLLTGMLGTASMPEMATNLAVILRNADGIGDASARTVLLAVLMVLVGLAFKLSLVPFHFWCPDAFEGASAEVAGFLSVASKAAAFGLLVRFCLAFVGGASVPVPAVFTTLGLAIGAVAAVTITFGNLAAYSQTNAKRLLAYSTIAHAGFMLMAVAAMIVVRAGGVGAGWEVAKVSEVSQNCIEGLLFYLFVYLFMNLGAFAVIAILRNYTFSEEIVSLNGLGWQAPALGACLFACVFSLVGLPPLGGFWGKFLVFMSVYQATGIHWFMWVLLVVGGANTVFSLFYYIQLLKAMFIRERSEGAREIEIPAAVGNYALLLALPVVCLGFFPSSVTELAHSVAEFLLS